MAVPAVGIQSCALHSRTVAGRSETSGIGRKDSSEASRNAMKDLRPSRNQSSTIVANATIQVYRWVIIATSTITAVVGRELRLALCAKPIAAVTSLFESSTSPDVQRGAVGNIIRRLRLRLNGESCSARCRKEGHKYLEKHFRRSISQHLERSTFGLR